MKKFIYLTVFIFILMSLSTASFSKKNQIFSQNQYLDPVIKKINAKPLTIPNIQSVRIGVIDTGIYDHPNLNIKKTNSNFNTHDNSHGTGVLGIIGASKSNDNGFEGILPGISLYVYNIPSKDLNNKNLASGIDKLVKEDVKIINISLSSPIDDYILLKSVQRAVDSGVTIVCSSGNSANNTLFYPAAYSIDGVISVGALNNDLDILESTTVNEQVDIYTPGENIYSLSKENSEINVFTGTSISTPIVTSIVAILKAKHTYLSPKEIEDIIKNTSFSYEGRWGIELMSIKLLNVDDALNYEDGRGI